MVKPKQEEQSPDGEITLTCKSCRTDIKMKPENFERQKNRLIRCPSCKSFIKVTRPAPVEEVPPNSSDNEEEAPSGGGRDLARTMRLDTLLDYLPQTKSVQESKCAYCASQLRHLGEKAFICDKCQRVIRTVSP